MVDFTRYRMLAGALQYHKDPSVQRCVATIGELLSEIEWMHECVEEALDATEEIFMHADLFDGQNRVVRTNEIIRIAQELNAALEGRQEYVDRESAECYWGA